MRSTAAQWEQVRKTKTEIGDTLVALRIRGEMALAAGRYDEAVADFRGANASVCDFCYLPEIGRAFDLASKPDSAIAAFTSYLAIRSPRRSSVDGPALAGVHKRLGELYEAKGNRADALSHYNTFLTLWKDADPELQPKVQEVRQRVSRLSKSSEKP